MRRSSQIFSPHALKKSNEKYARKGNKRMVGIFDLGKIAH